MKGYLGIDLGSTTTKAVLLDDQGRPLGRGITNSRSNYDLAARLARQEALVAARFAMLEDELATAGLAEDARAALRDGVQAAFRHEQHLAQLGRLRELALEEAEGWRMLPATGPLERRLVLLFGRMQEAARTDGGLAASGGFFRDGATSRYSHLAEDLADPDAPFDSLMGVFDKAILRVENEPPELGFGAHIGTALERALTGRPVHEASAAHTALARVLERRLDVVRTLGTGYGRQRLPFPKEDVRSEILCHGLGAHHMFPATATVLDIGGQDTKAIQVDADGIVTSFQMNDRCAAGCGRYLGYIADEMNLGVHELGPMAMQSTRRVRITSTCTVFAGAELRDRLALGQRREDILAGLHRSVIMRAMSLLARAGGISDEFTFTGGVANNVAAVTALRELVEENYGARTINISPDSIYTGALGAALFALRDGEKQ